MRYDGSGKEDAGLTLVGLRDLKEDWLKVLRRIAKYHEVRVFDLRVTRWWRRSTAKSEASSLPLATAVSNVARDVGQDLCCAGSEQGRSGIGYSQDITIIQVEEMPCPLSTCKCMEVR